MKLIREVENVLSERCALGQLPGPVHLYIGQEAVAAGVCSHLRKSDWTSSTHRGHGHFLAKGGEVDALMAEIYGRSSGVCRGFGGSMHVTDVSKGMMGANGIVGGGLALITGAALSAQLDGAGGVAVCFFGDGAANQGVFMEALNVSALWKLPLIFVCEHNGFSEFSPADTVTSGEIWERALPLKVPAEVVDGNDVLAVWEATRAAVARARKGEGPTLLEARTYRIRGHVEYENTFLSEAYRTEEELKSWENKDPIVRYRAHIIKQGLIFEDSLHAMDREISEIVAESVVKAEAAPWPSGNVSEALMMAGGSV